jgi:hypothetical protein
MLIFLAQRTKPVRVGNGFNNNFAGEEPDTGILWMQ